MTDAALMSGREKTTFSADSTGTRVYPDGEKLNPGRQPHTGTKINSRWTVDVNVKGKAIVRIGYNRGDYLHNLGIGNDSLNKNKKINLKGKN